MMTWYSRSLAAPTSRAKMGLALPQRSTALATISQFEAPNSLKWKSPDSRPRVEPGTTNAEWVGSPRPRR